MKGHRRRDLVLVRHHHDEHHEVHHVLLLVLGVALTLAGLMAVVLNARLS